MYKVTIIQPDGKTETKNQREKPNLEQIQKAVKGMIQHVPDFKKFNGRTVEDIWCNEEGKLIGQPVNWWMTTAWREYLDSTKRPYDPGMAILNGPVMIVQRAAK